MCQMLRGRKTPEFSWEAYLVNLIKGHLQTTIIRFNLQKKITPILFSSSSESLNSYDFSERVSAHSRTWLLLPSQSRYNLSRFNTLCSIYPDSILCVLTSMSLPTLSLKISTVNYYCPKCTVYAGFSSTVKTGIVLVTK